MARRRKRTRDQRKFSKTAKQTRLINVNPKFMRGGIRL